MRSNTSFHFFAYFSIINLLVMDKFYVILMDLYTPSVFSVFQVSNIL